MSMNDPIDYHGYLVFENGIVLNKNGTQKKFSDNGRGYPISRFVIDGKWKTMTQHTVVANCYLGDRPEGFEVNHIDNNKWNNSTENLEYISKRDNRLQMYKDGRDASVKRNANAKYTKSHYYLVKFLHRLGFDNYSELSRLTGVGRTSVIKMCKGTHYLAK